MVIFRSFASLPWHTSQWSCWATAVESHKWPSPPNQVNPRGSTTLNGHCCGLVGCSAGEACHVGMVLAILRYLPGVLLWCLRPSCRPDTYRARHFGKAVAILPRGESGEIPKGWPSSEQRLHQQNSPSQKYLGYRLSPCLWLLVLEPQASGSSGGPVGHRWMIGIILKLC